MPTTRRGTGVRDLGGRRGAFGNGNAWIDGAIERAMGIVADAGLEISIVAHGHASPAVRANVERYWVQGLRRLRRL
jgi:hypothetical protein